MGSNEGSFGSISYQGNAITINIDPDSLGDIAVTTNRERIQCFWDGNQWVCNAISFGQDSAAQE